MKKQAITLIIAAMVSLCLTVPMAGAAAKLVSAKVKVVDVEIELLNTADNFIVLFDTSSSMGEKYKDTGLTVLEAAKKMLKDRNEAFPDISYNAALYTFTPKMGAFLKTPLKEYYAPQPYDKAAFGAAIDQLPTEASGSTPLQKALWDLDPILEKLPGRTVVILMSNGTYSKSDAITKTPVEIAKGLAAKYDVVFTVVSTAEGEKERKLLSSVASINAGSRVVRFDDLYERPDYLTGTLFVIEETVIESLVNKIGIKLDNIHFEIGKADLDPKYHVELDKAGKFLKENPKTFMLLAGFSDNTGSEELNMKLSRMRVENVSTYLKEKFGLADYRLVTNWYGSQAPIGNNHSAKGRAMNRRVVGIVAGL